MPGERSGTRSSIWRRFSRRFWSTIICRASRFAGLILVALGLAGCNPDPAAFKSVDVTGAGFGRELRLTDHTGRPRTLADFKGKVVVVFFGYTQCPDVCPTTLVEMKVVKEKLGKDGDRLQVLFVTVDPERDTPALLAKYVPAFDPSFLGLYGDTEATERTAKEFKVYYKKVPGGGPGSYTVDHTAALFVFDPSGRLRLFAKHGQGADALAHDIRLLIDRGG